MFEYEQMNVLVYDVSNTITPQMKESIGHNYRLNLDITDDINYIESRLECIDAMRYTALVIVTDSMPKSIIRRLEGALQLLKREFAVFAPEVYLLLDDINPKAEKIAKEYSSNYITDMLYQSRGRHYFVRSPMNMISYQGIIGDESIMIYQIIRQFALRTHFSYVFRREDATGLSSLNKLMARDLIAETGPYVVYFYMMLTSCKGNPKEMCRRYADFSLLHRTLELLIGYLAQTNRISFFVYHRMRERRTKPCIKWEYFFPNDIAGIIYDINDTCCKIEAYDEFTPTPLLKPGTMYRLTQRLFKFLNWMAATADKDITQSR